MMEGPGREGREERAAKVVSYTMIMKVTAAISITRCRRCGICTFLAHCTVRVRNVSPVLLHVQFLVIPSCMILITTLSTRRCCRVTDDATH